MGSISIIKSPKVGIVSQRSLSSRFEIEKIIRDEMACVLDAENSSNALKRRKNLSSTNMQINESDYYNQSPVSEGKTRRLSLTILPAEERLMDDEGLKSLVSGKLYQIIDGINNNKNNTYSNNYISNNNNNGNR